MPVFVFSGGLFNNAEQLNCYNMITDSWSGRHGRKCLWPHL